jgi:hypothetical protein
MDFLNDFIELEVVGSILTIMSSVYINGYIPCENGFTLLIVLF